LIVTLDHLVATHSPTTSRHPMPTTATLNTTDAATSQETKAPSGPSQLERLRATTAAAAMTAKPIPHKELISAIETHLRPVDYRMLAGKKEDGTVSADELILYTAEQLISQSEQAGFAVALINRSLYLYNRALFKPLDEDDARRLLTSAAIAFGVPGGKAKLSAFKDKAYQQLLDLAPKLDTNPDSEVVKINAQNGTVHINMETGEATLHPFCASDAMRYQLSYAYDPTATAPEFDRFLREVQPDKSVRYVMAEWQGYVFLPSSTWSLERTMLYFGGGANGKSVMAEIVKAMYGAENVSAYSLEDLTNKDTTRAQISDKILNLATEIGKKMNTTTFKTLSSGETIDARYFYKDPFMMNDYGKLQFNCNELPFTSEHTEGYQRRFIIVPFNITIAPERQDVGLKKRIIANELPGVLNWAIEGLQRLIKQDKKFTESAVINETAEQHKENGDSILRFIKTPATGYAADPTQKARALGQTMYLEYKAFCEERGISCQGVSDRLFYDRLESLGRDKLTRCKKGNHGVQFFANRRPFQD
jgi:putative DNA primase/helicase